MEVFIALAETSGLRRGELVNLHWRDIDFDAGSVRVSAKRAGEFAVGNGDSYPIMAWSAKSYEERTVPIPESTVALLIRLQDESDVHPMSSSHSTVLPAWLPSSQRRANSVRTTSP